MRKKIAALLLSAVLCAVSLTAVGCKNSMFIDKGEEINTAKTQLYVHNYNGGVGTEWLEQAKARFEEKYAETPFEEGKKGVQIIISRDKEMRADLENTLTGSSVDDVYFSEHAFYSSWAKKGLLLDITDIVAQKDLSEFGDSGTIADKLSANKKAMLTSVDGKYYGLPHYEGFQGVNYNVKLFDQKGFYFNADGGIIAEQGGVKSAGPDGVSGNTDDGLPASIEQLEKLCGYMDSVGVKPFIWTGQYNEYFTILLDALTTSVLGKDAAELVYSFNETSDGDKIVSKNIVSRVITGFNGDNPRVGTTVINETTGYLLWQREELYYVLDFAQKVIANQWYAKGSTNGSFDHQAAQESFVNGTFSPQVGMLIDGNYWEKEASEAIARSERDHKYNYETDADFAWMPLPTTVKGNTGDSKMTLRDATAAYAFIHKNVPEVRKELAKKFLQFCYCDAELKNFTQSTGMTRDLSYALGDEQTRNLSKYSQSILNYKKTADLVNTNSTCVVFQANEEILTNTFWRTQADTTYDRPYIAFYNGNVSAKNFFLGLGKLHARSDWDGENRGNYHAYELQSEENITPVA